VRVWQGSSTPPEGRCWATGFTQRPLALPFSLEPTAFVARHSAGGQLTCSRGQPVDDNEGSRVHIWLKDEYDIY